MTRQQWTVLGVTAAIAAVGVVAVMVLRGGGGPDDKPSVASCVPAPGKPVPLSAIAEAPGALRVAEKGFSRLGPDKTIVSLGAIVENTADKTAYRTPVTFRVQGATVAQPSTQLTLEVPIILPGQRIPVGSWAYVTGTASAIDVEIGRPQWLAPGALPAFTAHYESTSRTTSDPETGTVAYTATSPYCAALIPRGVAMVFRDASDAVVGGSFELGAEKCAPMSNTERATAQRSMPTTIDERKTQVLSYCDFEPAGPKTGGLPFN